MRKKIFAVVLTIIFALSMMACGDTAGESSNTDKEESSTTQEISLDGLEKHLLSKGVLSGEKTTMAAEMIGAISGFKYSDSNAEFYEFDTNSEAYKTFSGGGSVELEGFEGYEISATAINGRFVLITSADTQVSQSLLDAFYSYK